MQRTQIYLDNELKQSLQSREKMQGKGLSELIRQILSQSLKREEQTADAFLHEQESGSIFLLSPIVSAEIYAGAFKKEYPFCLIGSYP